MKSRVFVGTGPEVEAAINAWANEDVKREVTMVFPLPVGGDGLVGLVFLFEVEEPGRPRVIVPK